MHVFYQFFSALTMLIGWEERHPASQKTHLNNAYYQGDNWLTQVHVENGHWNGVCVCMHVCN